MEERSFTASRRSIDAGVGAELEQTNARFETLIQGKQMDPDAVDACSVRKHTLERRLEYLVGQFLPQERGARALAGANSTYTRPCASG